MNIYDFPNEFSESHIPRMFEYIFMRQHELAEKYIPIEDKNGLRWTTDYPVEVDSGKGQAQLKDMAWRTVEEAAESFESIDITKDSIDHHKEELADGLHFITELLLLVGLSYKDIELAINSDIKNLKESANLFTKSELFVQMVVQLGIAMNNLKMKPWKQTPMQTDIKKLHEDLIKAYVAYIKLMLKAMEPLEILKFYFSKSDVNQFRIRSKY